MWAGSWPQFGSWVGACLLIAAVWLLVILVARSVMDGRPGKRGRRDHADILAEESTAKPRRQ